MLNQMNDKQEALYRERVSSVFDYLRDLAVKQGVYFSTVMRRIGISNPTNYQNFTTKLGIRHVFLMMNKYGINPSYFFGLSASMMIKDAKKPKDSDTETEKGANIKRVNVHALEREGWVSLRKNPDQVKAAEIMSGEHFHKKLTHTNDDVFVLFADDGDVLDWVVVECVK